MYRVKTVLHFLMKLHSLTNEFDAENKKMKLLMNCFFFYLFLLCIMKEAYTRVREQVTSI